MMDPGLLVQGEKGLLVLMELANLLVQMEKSLPALMEIIQYVLMAQLQKDLMIVQKRTTHQKNQLKTIQSD